MLVDTIMGNSIKNMEMQVFLAADLTGAFKIVDIDGFDGPLNFIRITSTMDEPIIISFDGTYGHEFLWDDDSIDLNAQSCSRGLNRRSLFRNKTKVYVKSVGNLPKVGTLIVSGFYQD